MAAKIFAKRSDASRLFKTQSKVSGVTNVVVDIGVRTELGTTLTRSPFSGGLDELSTNPLTAGVRDNIPALQIGDAIRGAAVHDIAD